MNCNSEVLFLVLRKTFTATQTSRRTRGRKIRCESDCTSQPKSELLTPRVWRDFCLLTSDTDRIWSSTYRHISI